MNIHKSRRIKKGTTIKVYPLGGIEKSSSFCDILKKNGDMFAV